MEKQSLLQDLEQPKQNQAYIPQAQSYSYDQTWTPPPAIGSDNPNVNVEYNYDPFWAAKYHITVDQWSQIENDISPYSHYWAKGEFTPEKFIQNQKKESGYLDKGWMIAFWINFAISLILMIVIVTVKIGNKEYESQIKE